MNINNLIINHHPILWSHAIQNNMTVAYFLNFLVGKIDPTIGICWKLWLEQNKNSEVRSALFAQNNAKNPRAFIETLPEGSLLRILDGIDSYSFIFDDENDVMTIVFGRLIENTFREMKISDFSLSIQDDVSLVGFEGNDFGRFQTLFDQLISEKYTK